MTLTRHLMTMSLLLAAMLLAAGCGGDASDEGVTIDAADILEEQADVDAGEGAADGDADMLAVGRELFIQQCASCHALEDAGATSAVGPSFNDEAWDAERVLAAITNGPGIMPANLVTGDDAQAVADYVADATS